MSKHAHNFIDLTGKRFGRLVVTKYKNKNKQRNVYWECLCDCGKVVIIMGNNLRRNFTTSCGCLRKEMMADKQYIHGMTKTRIHNIWLGMKRRCQDPKSKTYFNYGGRGITVCEWWQIFENFYQDMKDGYTDALTLDRIDSNGNYEKSNCKWSTQKEQQNNRRDNHLITFQGKTQTMAQWARELKINQFTLKSRLNQSHWSIEKAFTTSTK